MNGTIRRSCEGRAYDKSEGNAKPSIPSESAFTKYEVTVVACTKFSCGTLNDPKLTVSVEEIPDIAPPP
jgi:hypothetical protein